ncbi:hypothetical protein [Thermoflexus hugenholtzii]
MPHLHRWARALRGFRGPARGIFSLFLAFLALSGGVSQARADHDGNPEIRDIVLTVPQTYALCPNGSDLDTIAVSNVGSRWLRGFVQLDFVIPDGGGRQMVQRWEVLQGGDYQLQVIYPAWETWPVGFFEMHVDLALEVYPTEADARAGTNLLGVIGPGHPWDIFCLAGQPAPSPTPTATATPTTSPTETPTPTPTNPVPATAVPPLPMPLSPTPRPTDPLDGELLGPTGGSGEPSRPFPTAIVLGIAGGLLILGLRSRSWVRR